MKEHIRKVLEEVPSNMNRTTKTLSANHLFNVNDRVVKLPHDKAELFHHIMAKLLYIRTQRRMTTRS